MPANCPTTGMKVAAAKPKDKTAYMCRWCFSLRSFSVVCELGHSSEKHAEEPAERLGNLSLCLPAANMIGIMTSTSLFVTMLFLTGQSFSYASPIGWTIEASGIPRTARSIGSFAAPLPPCRSQTLLIAFTRDFRLQERGGQSKSEPAQCLPLRDNVRKMRCTQSWREKGRGLIASPQLGKPLT
jgi:hypothetical protein